MRGDDAFDDLIKDAAFGHGFDGSLGGAAGGSHLLTQHGRLLTGLKHHACGTEASLFGEDIGFPRRKTDLHSRSGDRFDEVIKIRGPGTGDGRHRIHLGLVVDYDASPAGLKDSLSAKYVDGLRV